MSAEKKQPVIDLFKEEEDRFTLWPLRHPGIFEFWNIQNKLHWSALEVSSEGDRKDYNDKCTPGDRHTLKHILAFFGPGDEFIMKSVDGILQDIKIKEFQFVYRAIDEMECVHSHSYSLQIDSILSDKEKEEIFESVKTLPIIAEMKNWIEKNTAKDLLFENRILAQSSIESILFVDKFAIISSFKKRNILHGLCTYNEFISRDEQDIHVMFAIYIINNGYVKRPEESVAHRIYKEAANLSIKFIDVAVLKNDVPQGLTIPALKDYVRYNCDIRLEQLGYKKLYNIAANPLKDILEFHALGVTNKVDFFARTVSSQYQNLSKDALVYKINESPIELR